MYKIFKSCFSFMGLALAASTFLFTQLADADVIYSNGFESMSVGKASKKDVKDAWDSRYSKGVDEGRLTILNGGVNVKSGKAGQVLYPKGGNQPMRSGATWETDINRNAEEFYLSYWVKFDSDFQWVKGGKLPGLAGMTYFPGGENRFTVRLMWREEGKIEFYVHGFKMNNSEGDEPYRIYWDDFGGHAKFQKGKWHHIEMRIKLNTPGKRDGLLQGWLDGKLRSSDSDNAGIRAAGQGSTKLNYMFFSTFFGGSSLPASQWQPKKDVYAYFDDFKISTSRIGKDSGSVPGGSDSGGSNLGGFDLGGSDSGDSNSGDSNSGDSNSGDSNSGDSSSGGSSSDDSNSDDSSSDDSSSDGCVSYTSGRKEIDLHNASCVNVEDGLSGKTLQVWDSDKHSCDFRGKVNAANGKGSMNVPDNYESKKGFTGSVLNFNASNGCKFVKMRVY